MTISEPVIELNADLAPNVAPVTIAPGAGDDVPVGSPAYNELLQFLYQEAALLDHHRIQEWSTLLAEDLSYTSPIRLTRNMADMKDSYSPVIRHFDDDYMSMMGRVGRLVNTKSAWSEDPPSRTRRFVTNLLVRQGASPDEYEATSYLYVARSRFESPDYSVVTCERNDLLRRDGSSFKIARREILMDQATLGMSNFAIFF